MYQTDTWEFKQWKNFQVRSKDKELKTCIESMAEKLYSFPQMALEVYVSLYKAWGLQPVEKPLPESQWAREIFDQLVDQPSYKDLQRKVQNSYFLSGLAAATLIKSIAKKLTPPPTPPEDPNEIRKEVLALMKKQRQDEAEAQAQADEKGEAEPQSQGEPNDQAGNSDGGESGQAGKGESGESGQAGQGEAGEGESGQGGQAGEGESGQSGQAGEGQGGSQNQSQLMAQLKKQGDAARAGKQDQIDNRQEYINQLISEGKAARAVMEDYAESIKGSIEFLIDSALEEALEKVEEAEEMMHSISWGVGGGTQTSTTDMETALKLHQEFNKDRRFRSICHLAGRLKREAANKVITRTKKAHTYFEDVTAGKDLEHLVGSEYMNLSVPLLQPVFYKRFAETALIQNQLGGDEISTEGPIVILRDISGSTRDGGTWIEEYIAAMCLTFIGIAASQNRHCRLVHFDDSNSTSKTAVRRIDDFPPGENDFGKLMQALSFYTGGGTNWMDPLDSALECIQTQSIYEDADIILITDGHCNVDQDWLKNFKNKQEELGFTIFGVLIGRVQKSREMESFIPENQIVAIDQKSFRKEGDSVLSSVFSV